MGIRQWFKSEWDKSITPGAAFGLAIPARDASTERPTATRHDIDDTIIPDRRPRNRNIGQSLSALMPHDAMAQRLKASFGQFRAGEITRAEYIAQLRDEESACKARRSHLRADRSLMTAADFEEAVQDAEDDLEVIRWRLGWFDYQN